MFERFLQTNSTVTAPIVQQTSALSSAEWVTVFSNVVMAAMSLALVIYAALTIREAKRDRRKDTVERTLENVYTPLYAILPRGESMEGGSREKERELARIEIGCHYVFYESEVARMLEILERFGHYIDPLTPWPLGVGDRFRDVLEKPSRVQVWGGRTCYGFDKGIGEFFGYVVRRRRELVEELHRLAEASSK